MTDRAEPSNPLAGLADADLWDSQILLAIVCNRGNFATNKRRSRPLCALGNALNTEANRRGVPSPQHPWSLGNLKA